MRASIMSYADGLELFEGVQLVRVKSKDYNMLIMDGFVSTLGRIEGTVTVLTGEEERMYKNVQGYFQQKDDRFSFLIEGTGDKTV